MATQEAMRARAQERGDDRDSPVGRIGGIAEICARLDKTNNLLSKNNELLRRIARAAESPEPAGGAV